MTVSLNTVARSLVGYLVIGDGVTFTATSTSGDWPATTRLRIANSAGVESALTPIIATTLATWTLTVAEVTALIGTKTSGQLNARVTHGTGDALRGILAGEISILTRWRGVRGAAQSLGTVVVGPEGPTAVSADADNVASLGTDGLIYVAPGAGTVASVNGKTGAVVLDAADVGAEPAKGADDNFVTDAQLIVLAATSGTNTGDQTLPTWSTIAGKPAVVAEGATQADARTAISAAPTLGADDNYVTDAEKIKLSNLSGTNTGDQTLPTWSTISGKPAVVGAGATQADARTAIGAGTSSFSGAYADLSGKPTLGDAAAKNTGTTAGTVAAGDDSRFSSSGIAASIVDAKGDLIVATAADTVARLAVGATTGHVLTVDPAESTGLKWAPSAGGAAAETLSPFLLMGA